MNAEVAELETRESLNWRRLVLDIAYTAGLLALVVFSILKIQPAISGKALSLSVSVVLAPLAGIGVLILLSLIERLFPPAGPRKSLRNYFLHLQINIFYGFVSGIATVLALLVTTTIVQRLGISLGLIDLRLAHGKGILALIGTVWLSAIAGDFFFYWYHRTLHKVPFLWALHKMHHMDQELEALTVARENWFDVIPAALIITIPTAIFFKIDDDYWTLGIVAGVVSLVFQTILTVGHLNVRLEAGKGSVFWCTPQIHRIHHSRLPHHADKNFAFVFPLWDVIFGTYCAPKRGEFPPTGVDGEKEIGSFWESQIFTQREWWKMFRAWRRRNTLSAD